MPARSRRTSRPARAARGVLAVGGVGVVSAVVLLGVWVTGGVLTDDATLAKTLTALWFAASGAAVLLVARRAGRGLAGALIGSWLLTSVVAGGFLLVTSEVDRVVHEDVVVAERPIASTSTAPASSPAPAASSTSLAPSPPAGPRLEASGRFRSGEHVTRGRADLVRTPDGRRVLTLTGFSTAPGPDLRVHVVPGRPGRRDAVDLGRLKGNRGDQQYAVPDGVAVGSVVIWCRAFSVDFGTAVLRPAG